MKQYPWKSIVWVTVFAIAMGFLESSVVIYLRALYYPAGFDFPLNQMSDKLALTEIFREAATIIMLIGIGVTTGKTFLTRFGYFIYAFAIWDIFYYVFLKIILNWPESLFTWDILFLIPSAWVGPILSPIISSTTMIILFFIILYKNQNDPNITFDWKIWSLLIVGSVIIIYSWMIDFINYINSQFPEKFIFNISFKDIISISNTYIPKKFSWWIFIIGELILFYAFFRFLRKTNK